ncbi:hypothetical protein GE061_001653 [Apolygus lucorum]|uniref:Uncharacterized protein n=1 Tax=Apolygus lucorum TaxID=248454 RepID=A0A6A4K984_APOLU|nr:hypothetical protein GE061_001653 [Apolygus lucorum]
MRFGFVISALAALLLVCYAHAFPEPGEEYNTNADGETTIKKTWDSEDGRHSLQVHGIYKQPPPWSHPGVGPSTQNGGFRITHRWR